MSDHPLHAALQTVFTEFIAEDDVDVVSDPDALAGDGFEVQADEWTLSCTGWPIARAWVAIDTDVDVPDEMPAAIKDTLDEETLDALRELDRAASGSLRAALAQSHDPLSMALATVMAR